MLTGEVPASTILLHRQVMAGNEMPSKHLAAPPAFQTNDIIAMDGAPDCHGGGRLTFGFGCGFSEPGERPMDGRDQFCELVGPDLVSPNVGGNDRRSEFSVDRGG